MNNVALLAGIYTELIIMQSYFIWDMTKNEG